MTLAALGRVKPMSFYEFIEKAHQMEAAGKKVVRFDVGDTNLPAPLAARQAAAAQMKKERSAYGPAGGLHALRAAIAEREGCREEEVVVGPGSKHLIFALLNVLAIRGDSVLVPTPSWPAYPVMCRHLGLGAKLVECRMENNWQPEELGMKDQRLLILCNPLNPTSTTYSEDWMEESISRAKAAGAHVILDEPYRGLAYEPIPAYEGAIRVRSFSKEFNMEGWRLAYAVAPPEVVRRLVSFNQITISCVPDFVQLAGVKALENEKEVCAANLAAWKERQATAASILRAGGFEFAGPQAGIYLFMRHPEISDAEEFAGRLLEKHGVAISAGASFGPSCSNFMRICPNLDGAKLREACEKIRGMVNGN